MPKDLPQTTPNSRFHRSVLNIPVVSVEILDGTQIQLAEYDHPNFYTAVDVCAKLEDGTQVIIEVQVTKQRSFFNRMLAYLANQITDNLKRLKTDQNKTHTLYSKMDPVYCIAILEKNTLMMIELFIPSPFMMRKP